MRIRTLLLALNVGLAGIAVQVAIAQNDWPSYGRDPGAQRYSPLTQINPGNVSTLVQAWKYETRPASSVAKSQQQSKTTPLMVNNVVYFVTPFQSLVTVEPETGKTLWTFDHQHAARTSRGIAYWPGNKNAPPTIFFGTEDGFLIGVNARTGKLVPGFAKEGELDLKPGMKGPGLESAPYGLNGAPAIYKNLVFTGTHLQDNGSYGGRGDVRAWDAATGKLVWTFHTVPQPGEVGHETWLDDGWKNRSGVNVWSTFSVDTETGTLLMPIGGPSDDRYGGDRPGANLFGNSLVAVDAMTGKMKWYLQTTHHDLWDTGSASATDAHRRSQGWQEDPGVNSDGQVRPGVYSGSPNGESHLRPGGAARAERRCSGRVVLAHAAVSAEASAACAHDLEAR